MDYKHLKQVLTQHPFVNGNLSALKFNQIINAIHLTNKTVIMGGRQGSTFVADLGTLKRLKIVQGEKQHTNVKCITSCDQLVAMSGSEGIISIWWSDSQTKQHKLIKLISCHGGKDVRCIEMNKTFVVSFGTDCRIVIHKWNICVSTTKSIESQLSLFDLGASAAEQPNLLEQFAEIKADNESQFQSIVLHDTNIFFVDGYFLKHYQVIPDSGETPHMANQMRFTNKLYCLINSNEENPTANIPDQVKNSSYRFFWVGTTSPGKIMKVDIEAGSVLFMINVFEEGRIKQISDLGQHLLCNVQETTKGYSSCLCYDMDDITSQHRYTSPSSSPTTIPFRQFVNFGEITSELCIKGDYHVFYYKFGEFHHLSLKDIVSLPKQTTLRPHPEFD